MIANVSTSSDIAFTLAYGQNPEKGGGIILCNYTDERAGAEQQARDWEALSNPYRNKCYTIVVSFGNKDTEKKNISDNKQSKIRRNSLISLRFQAVSLAQKEGFELWRRCKMR